MAVAIREGKELNLLGAEWIASATHRTGITAVDTVDPPTVASGVNCRDYMQCRFDIVKNSGTVTTLEVQILFWNSKQGAFMRGSKLEVDELPKAIVTDVRGAIVFLKVTKLEGTTPNISIDYSLS